METVDGPRDMWTLQEEIRALKIAQYEHAERLSRLENRQDDSKIRSLWPWSTPFPAPLSTFSQATPNNHEQQNAFHSFEENLIAGLELDEVDVPRRGASRANSVRFDDSAITNHWIHDSSPSASDYFRSRSSNNVEDCAMTERSMSHKSDQRSDGRQSSMRSYADTGSSFDGEGGVAARESDILHSNTLHPSTPTPGSGPAIIRCLFDANSPFDPFIYAVVCTGSTRSFISQSLVNRLGIEGQIRANGDKDYMIELCIYLPDAASHLLTRDTSRVKMPQLTIDFAILPINQFRPQENDLAVLFVGSDVISAHMGDVLFSQRKLVLYADDGRNVCVPFVRPDSGALFPDACTMDVEARHSDIFSSINNHSTGIFRRTDQSTRFSSSSSYGGEDGIAQKMSTGPIGQQKTEFNNAETGGVPLETADDHTSTEYVDGNAAAGELDDLQGEVRGRSKEGAEEGADTARRPAMNGHSLPRTTRDTDRKSDSQTVLRSRSYTSLPTVSGLPTGEKSPNGSVWDTKRKGSLGYSDSQPGTKPTRASSRGMKVLRTSKSSSLSEARANHHFNTKSSSTSDSKMSSSVAGIGVNKAIHKRANSGEGGAFQAFHWMAPKPAISG